MNPAAPAPELRALAPALAVVVAQILAGLRTLVAARFRVPAMAPHANALGGYLTRTWRRFDRLMARLAQRHPGYGWERNAGYGSPAHRAALHSIGVTAHHRAGFGTP